MIEPPRPDRLPPVAPRKQAYMRSRNRGNRLVRKKRLLRSTYRWISINALRLAILAILGAALAQGLIGVIRSEHFRLRTIRVEGLIHGSVRSIEDRLRPYVGHNLFAVDLDELEETVSRDPWVAHCSIKRLLPNTVRVRIHERVPAAVALLEGAPHLVDASGTLIAAANGATPDLPVLGGLDGADPADRARLLRQAVDGLHQLQRSVPTFAQELSELDLSRADRWIARSLHPGPDLLLDPERVDRNLDTYLAMRDEVDRRLGALSRVDLRWDGRIAFVPLELDGVN